MVYFWGGYELLIIVNQLEQIVVICFVGGVDFIGMLVWVYIGLESVDDLIVDLVVGFVRIV